MRTPCTRLASSLAGCAPPHEASLLFSGKWKFLFSLLIITLPFHPLPPRPQITAILFLFPSYYTLPCEFLLLSLQITPFIKYFSTYPHLNVSSLSCWVPDKHILLLNAMTSRLPQMPSVFLGVFFFFFSLTLVLTVHHSSWRNTLDSSSD